MKKEKISVLFIVRRRKAGHQGVVRGMRLAPVLTRLCGLSDGPRSIDNFTNEMILRLLVPKLNLQTDTVACGDR